MRHLSQRYRHAAVTAVATILLATGAQAQLASITTRLMGRIDSRRVTEGTPFFVKTISEWKQGRCHISMGATLEGRVTKVVRRGPGVKREELGLRFSSIPCSGDESQEVMPILVALHGPQKNSNDDMLAREEIMSVFASVAGAHSPTGPGGAAASGASTGTVGGRGGVTPMVSAPQEFRVGEVRDYPGVKISLPTYTSDPTTLSDTGELLFDPDARFVLVIHLVPRNAAPVVETAHADAPPPRRTPPPPPVEEIDLEKCVDTGCALADSPEADVNSKLERRLQLRSFGFRVRANRILKSLAEDAAVRFLGEDQLLITFNPHPLIARSQEESERSNAPRIIRALLVSAKTGKLIRAEDWRVSDEGTYLWPLDGGRVLAHIGDTLTIYGPGLTVEKQWTAPGAIHFLRVAPSRRLIVAAVRHERHTPDQHRRLADFLGPDQRVEEDYDLTILDGQLNVIGSNQLHSEPVLSEVLDTGLILSEQGTRQRWTISESNWDGKQRKIVRVGSSCPLRVETLPTNLILLVGCSADASHAWYKIVRPNGKILLTGITPSNNLLEHADAPSNAGVFAIGIAVASHPIDFGQGIVASDFQNVAVSVYRIADGRRLYAARSPNGAVNRQSFALSDSGNQLAILSGEDISLYRIAESAAVASNNQAQTR